MSKKVIVLADNSYTIRRIVELSFSEIDAIEVRSFENGAGIKEKLQQLNPAVVIVDVKLPETNGYEVCRFVNETPALRSCRVFLMKGSFEPVDSEMIKNLRYEDIVTKPFDSNALVAAVMKIVNREEAADIPGEGPTTFPEDFPEIETEMAESEDISFSDVRSEMDAPPVFERPAAAPALERDEILPSEEITQTQPAKDNLMPQETEEPLKNPFDEEPPFDEIRSGPPASEPAASIEYELEPPAAPAAAPAASAAPDAADEFHDRFLEIAADDTSDDLLKSSLAMPEAAEKLSLEFEQADLAGPAATVFPGPGDRAAGDLFAAPRAELEIDLDLPPARAEGKEHPRPEILSPQDELDRLSGLTKGEARGESQPKPAAPAAKPEPKPQPVAPTARPEPAPERFEMTEKLENRLNQSIRELLWEIVPPLAEKIIKEEIEKIKSELDDSGL